MPKNELPKYFQKYLDGKFEEISGDIGELKGSVNSIQNQLNNMKLMSGVIGGVASVLTSILNPLRR